MCRLPEPHELYDIYSDKQEDSMDRLPECIECGYKITDDYFYRISGDVYCERCVRNMVVYL